MVDVQAVDLRDRGGAEPDGNRTLSDPRREALVGPYSNIVDGDAKVYSIACASVVAKVVRDRMMERLAVRYPGYGWEHNQGYATADHRAAIRQLGLTPFHRRSFLALQRTLAGEQASLDLFHDVVGISIEPGAFVDVAEVDVDLAGEPEVIVPA